MIRISFPIALFLLVVSCAEDNTATTANTAAGTLTGKVVAIATGQTTQLCDEQSDHYRQLLAQHDQQHAAQSALQVFREHEEEL